MSILETPRLILRPLTLADAPEVQAQFGCWDIIQHMSMRVPWPYPEDGSEQFIQGLVQRLKDCPDDRGWGITQKDGGQLMGFIDYRSVPNAGGHRGFWMGVAWQGQGYMTEAVTAVQDYLFFEMKVDHIHVSNHINNQASKRIKEKTGAKWLRHIEIESRSGENTADLWEVTAERWAAYRKATA